MNTLMSLSIVIATALIIYSITIEGVKASNRFDCLLMGFAGGVGVAALICTAINMVPKG